MSRWTRLRLTVSSERPKHAVIRRLPSNGVLRNCWSISRIKHRFAADSAAGSRYQFGGPSYGTELQVSEAIALSFSLSRTSRPLHLHPWAHATSGIASRAPFPVTLAGVRPGAILVRHLTLPWHLFRPKHRPRSLAGAATPLVFLERLRHRDLHRRWPPRTHRQSPQELEDLLDDQAQIMALLPARLGSGLHLLPEPLNVPSKLVDHRVTLVLARLRFPEALSDFPEPCLDLSQR